MNDRDAWWLDCRWKELGSIRQMYCPYANVLRVGAKCWACDDARERPNDLKLVPSRETRWVEDGLLKLRSDGGTTTDEAEGCWAATWKDPDAIARSSANGFGTLRWGIAIDQLGGRNEDHGRDCVLCFEEAECRGAKTKKHGLLRGWRERVVAKFWEECEGETLRRVLSPFESAERDDLESVLLEQ